MALDLLSRAFLEIEQPEVVASRVLQEATCPAAPTCNLCHVNIRLYELTTVLRTYQPNHAYRALIMYLKLIAGCLPCCLSPLCLLCFVREGISG